MKDEYAGYAYWVLILKKKTECCWPVCRVQVYVRNVLLDSKTIQKNLRVDKYLVIFFFSRLRFEISRLRLRFVAG